MLCRVGLGNAIPGRFANPGISGLSLLNPGIPGLIPGLNPARLWLAIAAHSNRAVKLHVSSLAHGSF